MMTQWKIIIAPTETELRRDPKAQARAVLHQGANAVLLFSSAEEAAMVKSCMEQVPQYMPQWRFFIEPEFVRDEDSELQ